MGRGLTNKQAKRVAKGMEAHRKTIEQRARKAAGLPAVEKKAGRPRVEPAERWKDDLNEWDANE